MRKCKRCTLSLSVVVLSVWGFGGTASAGRLSIDPSTGGFRVIWQSLAVEVLEAFVGERIEVRCPVTLTGSFSTRTFVKTLGTELGKVTNVTQGEAQCSSRIGFETEWAYTARMQVLTETLPWSMQYLSFTGTLPAIQSIRARMPGPGFRVTRLGPAATARCTFRTEVGNPTRWGLFTETATGTIRNLRADESIRIPKQEEAWCDNNGAGVAGAASFTQAGSSSVVRLRLI